MFAPTSRAKTIIACLCGAAGGVFIAHVTPPLSGVWRLLGGVILVALVIYGGWTAYRRTPKWTAAFFVVFAPVLLLSWLFLKHG